MLQKLYFISNRLSNQLIDQLNVYCGNLFVKKARADKFQDLFLLYFVKFGQHTHIGYYALDVLLELNLHRIADRVLVNADRRYVDGT